MASSSSSALVLILLGGAFALAEDSPPPAAQQLRGRPGRRARTTATTTTTSLSPAPEEEAECVDTDRGAEDVEGYVCADYGAYPSYCVQDGAYDDSDFTLVGMCCACGAGAAGGDANFANCVDANHGAADVEGYVCADYSAYPSQCSQDGAYDDSDFTLVDMCCACGGAGAAGGNASFANCVDTNHGAADVDGYVCADYSAYPSQCSQDGAYDDEDFTLVDMCCACGGAGALSEDDYDAKCRDTNHGAADADGYACADYSAYPSQCVQDGAYDDEDFKLVDMCCACGGGAVVAR